MKAVIPVVEESKKGEKDWEEEEQAERIKGFMYQQVPTRTIIPGG